MPRPRTYPGAPSGLTILELMIVIAIIGLGLVVMRSGLRSLTNANLVEDATELEAFVKRASQLAIERGEQHRVVLDMDTGNYLIEVCQGEATLARNAELRADQEKVKQAVDRGKDRLRDLPEDALAVGDPDAATKRAVAIAGHHVNDRTCEPVTGGTSGISKKHSKDERPEWMRQLAAGAGVKFTEVWVQHRDDSTKKGQVAVHFFPNGSAEKAVIELSDGEATQTILVHALTGRVQRRAGKLDNVDDHMLRNALGDREKERESP